jgi:hypothetical protein
MTRYGGRMADYRLYFFDKADHIGHVVNFDCDTDAEAIELAATHHDGRKMELWSFNRLVETFPAKR